MRPTYLLLAGLLASCAPSPAPNAVTVAVATDLAPWARARSADLSASFGAPVRMVAGPSGQLATQLLAGAPFDLFLSADRITLDRLADDRRCNAASIRSFATGHLGIAVARHIAGQPSTTLLASDAVSRIAIANPEQAPYGRLAQAYLASLPDAQRIAPKIVFAASAADAAAWVEQGAVDAAVTAWSLLRTSREGRHVEVVDPSAQLPATGIVCGPQSVNLTPRWQAVTDAPWFRTSLTAAGFGPPP